MKCGFCSDTIHFWEDFIIIRGESFHTQILTLNKTLRCKRTHNKEMEKAEKQLSKKGD
jgi:hypothetical protein